MTAVRTDRGQYSEADQREAQSNVLTQLRKGVAWLFVNHLVWALLAVTLVTGAFVEGFLRSGNLYNVLWAAVPLGMMTLGLFFVMLIGRLDLSIESVFAFAPVLVVLSVVEWGLLPGAYLGLLFAILIGIGVGVINAFFSVKLGINAFLVTLAMLLTLRGLVIFLVPHGVYGLPEGITWLGGGRIAGVVPVAVIVLLLSFAAAHVLINYTAIGRQLFAIGSNESAAIIAGVKVERVKALAFLLAGACAAVGGMVELGRLDSVVADMGDGQILMVFAAATLGGTSLQGGEGKISGIFGATLVMAIIENQMNMVGIDPAIRQVVFGLILLGAISVSSLQRRVQQFV